MKINILEVCCCVERNRTNLNIFKGDFNNLHDPNRTHWLYSCVYIISNIIGSFQAHFIAEVYNMNKKTALFMTGYDSGPPSIEVVGKNMYTNNTTNVN